mgnify:CR=1 FL=1
MQIKGTGLKTTRDFVKAKFPSRYDEWLNSLPDSSKGYYLSVIDSARWYPMKEGYLVPVEKIVKIVYNGNHKMAGDALGEYSATVALTGVYKVFLFVATPNFLMSNASKMMSTFYSPSEIKISSKANKSVTLQITSFEDINATLEYRIASWCRKALELINCKNPEYRITKALSRNEPFTEIVFRWD